MSARVVDLPTVDVPKPWNLIFAAEESLRCGGYFIAYCPQITQAIRVANKLEKSKIKIEKVVEVLRRD